MARTPLAIAQGFYVDESKAIAAQECINLYPHIPATKTITDAALIGRSGISLMMTKTGVCRGGHVMQEIPYFLNGERLTGITGVAIEDDGTISSVGSFPSYGALINGTGRVVIADNGLQMCIVAPDYNNQFNAWIYESATNLVTQISSVNFDGPVADVSYFDGYFVFNKADSNKFFISELRDGFTYNALDFGSGESDPDNNVVIRPLDGLLYVFGNHTFEQWQDVGGAGFPFQRTSNGNQMKGCLAPHSMTYFNEALVWIGSSYNEKPAVWATTGADPIKLSTPAIDNLINSGGTNAVKQAFSMRWAERGHNFVAFTIPDVCTVVYDAMTQLWHSITSTNEYQEQIPWRASCVLSTYSTFFVGDTINGNLGVFDKIIHTEYGTEIHRRFSTPAIDNNGRPFSVNALELFCETGNVPITGQGSEPVIRMSISKDNGNTFCPEISRSLGKIGEYSAISYWPLLGRYRRPFIARFDISEPIKIVFVKAEAEITS
jgi:hypothetical protein